MTRYVVGFLFSGSHVALIRKNRPDWQKGRLNGIGGHIEEGETPANAMRREFIEEAGANIDNWREFVVVKGSEYELHCFTAYRGGSGLFSITSTTDEEVDWFSYESLPLDILPNLAWLIPMANYKFPLTGEIWHDSPEC